MQKAEQNEDMRIAVAGLGAIGRTLASALDAGMPGMRLTAVATRGDIQARAYLDALRHAVPSLAFGELPGAADVIVECAPAHLLPAIAEPALQSGRTLVVFSAGALLSHPYLADMADRHGGRIIVPSGAVGGLDAVAAIAQGATICKVKLVTSKPLHSLAGAPCFASGQMRMEEVSSPVCVFSGTAQDAAAIFPANMNVAAALALAGIGMERTLVEIWADPQARCNRHRIELESDVANMTFTIENHPSDNPKTSRIAALSAIALLRKMRAPLNVN
jgi:aspartate dehydrogenase